MKKVKQILAIIGVIVLVGLYISTIVCNLRDKDMVLYVNKIDAFQDFKTVEFHAIPFIKPS